jgi:TolB protein
VSSNDSDPAWSPDGQRIAFARQDRSGWHIWIMNVDGTNARPLTSGPFSDHYPSWSRDGATIYFARMAE